MKKLISLFIAALMIISVLPSVVFAAADADVQAVYDALTEEMLVTDNEPESSVTKNLNLDLTGDLTIPEGVAVSFASSDTSVIANDGTVTRDVTVKKTVTITATITKDGSDTLTKDFSFTVLPITQDVIVSDNLYYPQHTGKDLVSYATGSMVHAVPAWTLSRTESHIVTGHLNAKFAKDANGYHNATATRLEGDTDSYLRYAPTVPDIIQGADDKSVIYSINFNPVSWGSNGVNQLYLRLYGNTGTMIGYIQFHSDRTLIVDSAGAQIVYSAQKVKIGQDNNVQIKIDYNTGLMYVTLNGIQINSGTTALLNTNLTKQFAFFNFGYFRQMKDSVLQINDVAIIRETRYKVRSANDITSEILADGQVPSFITRDLALPTNSEITWASDNPTVISAEGKVSRPAFEDAVVNLTATDGTNTKTVQFTVKASTTSGVAANYSFVDTYKDPSLLGKQIGIFTDAVSSDVKYGASGGEHYIEYYATGGFDASKSVFTINTGTSFPAGSLGKYIIEYDAKFNNVQHVLVALLANGTRTVRVNNFQGAVKIGTESSTEWYGPNNTTYATITKDAWHKFRFEVDTTATTPLITVFVDNSPIVSNIEIAGSSYDTSIGIDIRARDASAENPVIMKIDNLRVYTESSPDEAIKAMSNEDKANYFAALIGTSFDNVKYYDLEKNVDLNSVLTAYDLEDLGVNVSWTSSDSAVISNNGTVTRQENSRYVVITATITAGDVTVTKEIPFTVAARDSKVYSKYNYTFESDAVGSAPADWTSSKAGATVTTHPERNSKVLQADFAGSSSVATPGKYEGALNKRYFVSADVCFTPEADTTKTYLNLSGPSTVTRIGFDYKTGGISLYGDNDERTYMVPGVVATPGEWYHIDIDFNVAKKNFMAYINGVAICAEPLDLYDNIWAGYLYIRQLSISSSGDGKGYLDNVIIRESNSNAPVYDTNSDYTVRSIVLTNQDDKTITNATATTTKVIAKVKVIKNRDLQDGTAKVLLARYDKSEKLLDIVGGEINTKAPGYETNGQILKVEMPITGGNSTDYFKIFVIDANTLKAYTKNYSSIAPKFDTTELYNMDMNVTPALELGYDAESEYENIDAIIYDGVTYKGRKTKHFAYIGLPEGASEDNPVPAVVCVHGGGGSAYDEWVKLWNDRGYAAISMNLNGRIPSDDITDGNAQLRHAWAGATQDNYSTVSPDDATWMYSAVTAAIGAHNVLREMPEVDNSKIGITGVSWGGVTTSTTIGVDNRFAFAIPIYGCGFLNGSETYMGSAMAEDEILWDASNFIGNASLPILWITGNKDGAFSLSSTTKSSLLASDNSYTSIIEGFSHSHPSAWEREEPYDFADSIVKGGTEFIRGEAVQEGSAVTVTLNRNAASAVLYYTTSSKLQYDSAGSTAQYDFSKISADNTNASEFTFTLPSDAKKFYVAFRDTNGNITSTVLYEVK